MGTEFYVTCEECKRYIDIHKAYSFSAITNAERPPVGVDCVETEFREVILNGNYWESRGLWFLYQHRGHKGVCLRCDEDELWWKDESDYVEVFPHKKDLEIRSRVGRVKSD